MKQLKPSLEGAVRLGEATWLRVRAWAERSRIVKEILGPITVGLVVVLIAHYGFGIG